MKYRVRLKGQDAFIRVEALSEADRQLVSRTVLKNAEYISWDAEKNFSQTIHTLKYNKTAFFRSDLDKAFKDQPEPIFQYLVGLSSHSLWIEINRTKNNVASWEKHKDWLFGLVRFEYHHFLRDTEYTEDVIPHVPYAPVVFFYNSLPTLIEDIRREYNKRIDKR